MVKTTLELRLGFELTLFLQLLKIDANRGALCRFATVKFKPYNF